ncbi:MAG TPA: hypothetical protein ACHBX0_07155 [Arsenophonus sp.]
MLFLLNDKNISAANLTAVLGIIYTISLNSRDDIHRLMEHHSKTLTTTDTSSD